MSETREIIVIRALQPELLNDYLNYFDRDAFADNPDWAPCYCNFFHAPRDQKPWMERTASENRAAVGELIQGRRMSGYLAYLGNRVIGWCNAGLRSSYVTLDDDPQTGPVGAIVCFNVSQPYRRQGVATLLLNAACKGFQKQGIPAVEAYPRKEANSDATHYHGPLAMFLDAGFEVVGEKDGVITVRKKL